MYMSLNAQFSEMKIFLRRLFYLRMIFVSYNYLPHLFIYLLNIINFKNKNVRHGKYLNTKILN